MMEKQTGFLGNIGPAAVVIGLVVVLVVICALVALMYGLDISEVIAS